VTAPYRLQRPVLHPIRDGRHNLPTSLSSFVGRERELAEAQARLSEARLLTLTGVGGCGKTRLALEVGRAVLDCYVDGVWLVELAALTEAALVPQSAAAVFGTRETPAEPIATALATTLRGQSLLLVLDNCEHLLDACAQLVDALLRACPELRVLATSREPLGITGELAWRVPSLPVPDPQQLLPFAQLEQNPAIRLFVERAAAVQPHFKLTARNACAVAQVCQRLDGIPLALELAAVRIQALTVDQLSARLDQGFRLFTGGSRTALPRQQTLRATLDWSYDLLSDAEKHLFNRLSVFVAGWTLEAAEAVCGGDGIDEQDVLDLLQRLVRKSLVVAEEGRDGAARYRLLETLRQYAHERLTAAGDIEKVQRQHASYYSALAAEAERGAWDQTWLERLLAEYENLRATMRWLSESNPQDAVGLGGRLWPMWVRGGFLTEGRTHLRTLLALQGPSRRSAEWAALVASDGLVALFAGEYAAARARLEEAVNLWRRLGDQHGLALALNYVATAAREQEDYLEARAWFEQSLALSDDLGDRSLSSKTLGSLGSVVHALGDYDLAQVRYEQSMALAERLDNRYVQAWALHNMGCLALDRGDYRTARARLTQSLELRDKHDNQGLVHMLAEFSALAAAEGLSTSALRLAAATDSLTQKTGLIVQHSERGRFERWLAAAQQAVGEEAAAAAWIEGYQMRLDQAIAYALAPREAGTVGIAADLKVAQTSHQLTPRQREVAALVGQGLTNRQIAERLVVTERAAAAHVERILDKLGVGSRVQIAVWASEHGLIATRSD
jgi:predicted ATPase/DNA-binding CsgD family transcriptional regulator/Tfp pilus assembly protein PilF